MRKILTRCNLFAIAQVKRVSSAFRLDEYKQYSDEQSLDFLLKNKNIGLVRFGNSELSYVAKASKDNQPQDERLRKKLVNILRTHSAVSSYRVGLPIDVTLGPCSSRRRARKARGESNTGIYDGSRKIVAQVYADSDYIYLSQFLFRLKNVIAPDKKTYIKKLRELFVGRAIIYVGPRSGRNAEIWDGISPNVVIGVPEENAFKIYDELKERVLEESKRYKNPLVLVVAGITATALAAELNEHGVTTYDLGQISRHVRACV